MSEKRLFILGLIFISVLAGCRGLTNSPENAVPKPELWYIQFTPSVSWMSALWNECARPYEDVGLIVQQKATANSNQQNDFIFQWGESEDLASQTVILGWDELVLGVNPGNPIQEIERASLRAIYQGELKEWPALSGSTTLQEPIRAWTYGSASNDSLRIFQSYLGVELQPDGLPLAPSPEAMITMLAGDATAVGYLPARWLVQHSGVIKTVRLEPPAPPIPILATITRPELTDRQKEWLFCIQEKLSQ